MQILCIFFHPQPSITALGGAEKRFLETSKIWVKNGIKVLAVEPEPSLSSRFAINYKLHKSSIRLFPSEKSWLNIYMGWVLWMLKACFTGASIAKRCRPNIVLAANNTLPNIIPAYFTHLLSKLPLCIVIHHLDLPRSNIHASLPKTYDAYRKMKYNRLTSLLKTLALPITLFIVKRSTVCVAVSKSTAKALTTNKVPKNKIHISGNGVNTRYIEDFRSKGTQSFDAVFVGRVSKEKGIYNLINAWQRVTDVKPHAKLAIIGSGVELPLVKETVKNRHLENKIAILGPLSDEDMYSTMKSSRVFVLPSLLEGWGLAVAEALACGLPAICYDIPAIREVFGGCKSVFLVPIGDVDELAATILHVLEKNSDKLTNVSKAYVRHLDWEKVAVRDLQIIKSVCSGLDPLPARDSEVHSCS